MYLKKYGVASHIYIPIVKRLVADFAVGADWTPAAGDVKISKDGGAAANVTNLPTAIAMGNTAMWDFSLTATELQAAYIIVTVADSVTKAVEDQSFVIQTFGDASAELAFDLDSATVTLADNGLTAAKIATDAITSDELATSALNEIADAVLDRAIAEPSTIHAWPASIRTILQTLGVLSRNKKTQTNAVQTIRNDADSATLWTYSAADDGTTTTKGEGT